MLNNKGFAVTTVLYTLLIAFLMFLGVTLATFSSSTRIVGNANNDLINGTDLQAALIKVNGVNKYTWPSSQLIVKINSRYGTMYWPRDFCSNNGGTLTNCKDNNNIEVLCYDSSAKDYKSCNNVNLSSGSLSGSSGENQSPVSTMQQMVTEILEAADYYIENDLGKIREDINVCLEEQSKDCEYSYKYSKNITVSVKWEDDISKYVNASSLYDYDDKELILELISGSYIINFTYNSNGNTLTYTIVDLLYLSKVYDEYVDVVTDYITINHSSVIDRIVVAMAFTSFSKNNVPEIESTYGSSIIDLTSTYSIGDVITSNPYDVSLVNSVSSKGLKVTDTLLESSVDLDVYNPY